jgi:hypothetical protein
MPVLPLWYVIRKLVYLPVLIHFRLTLSAFLIAIFQATLRAVSRVAENCWFLDPGAGLAERCARGLRSWRSCQRTIPVR